MGGCLLREHGRLQISRLISFYLICFVAFVKICGDVIPGWPLNTKDSTFKYKARSFAQADIHESQFIPELPSPCCPAHHRCHLGFRVHTALHSRSSLNGAPFCPPLLFRHDVFSIAAFCTPHIIINVVTIILTITRPMLLMITIILIGRIASLITILIIPTLINIKVRVHGFTSCLCMVMPSSSHQ